MNINTLNDLFPIVPYGSDSDSDKEMEIVAAPTSAEHGKLVLQQNTHSRLNLLFCLML